jgi:hypothetical protein
MMSATFTWTVLQMICKTQESGETDVVFEVQYKCRADETVSGEPYFAILNSSVMVPYSGGSFTPYDQLTEQQVLGWVWANGVDQAKVEASLQLQIDNQINPPVVIPPLPWDAPAA